MGIPIDLMACTSASQQIALMPRHTKPGLCRVIVPRIMLSSILQTKQMEHLSISQKTVWLDALVFFFCFLSHEVNRGYVDLLDGNVDIGERCPAVVCCRISIDSDTREVSM